VNAADAFFGIFGMTRVEEPLKLTTTIDVTLGRGQNMREHYRVRANRVKAERDATARALTAAGLKLARDIVPGVAHFSAHLPEGDGARVTLMRPIARIALDSDNLSGAFKGVRDEVASFLGVDDRSDRIHWVYTQEKGKGLKPTITIEVLPVGDIDPQVKRVRELEACLHRLAVDMVCLFGMSVKHDAIQEARRLLGMVTT
jgi:hypothetical protein